MLENTLKHRLDNQKRQITEFHKGGMKLQKIVINKRENNNFKIYEK